ncbi:hypothetical protein [Legionella londiniensis]|uniref:Uncharacterized protein n=1 Tax=Legionella londiniensis TaxID=45068 RepID=A0A0W0VS42_9GAMM|nr:hypothetical protein [Legionella londiniensis]KTD23024.1 hypothetical protein Llon_0258 [Legionella londiniensis]STX94041.1 Uncharacterised protein [Legionella londiniensis]
MKHQLSFMVSAYQNKHNQSDKKNAYKVKLLFNAEKEQAIDELCSVKLKFIPDNPVQPSGTVVDIYSLNWEASVEKKHQFSDKRKSKQILKEINSIPKNHLTLSSQMLLVLDIKTKECGYDNLEAIKSLEEEFLALFSERNPPPYIQQLKTIGLQFVFLEGKLKADLLAQKLFHPSQEKHLKSSSSDFCQLVEFIINAFKRGEKAIVHNQETGQTHTFVAEEYLKKTSPELTDFKPSKVSYTVYPPFYYAIATKGSYTKAMQQSGLFKINNELSNESDVVLMKTEKNTESAHVH